MVQDKLAAKFARLKAQAEQAQTRADADYEKFRQNREKAKSLNMELAAIERRVRNHRLIEIGALVEKVLGENIDKVILIGLLASNRELFNGSGEDSEIKAAGYIIISEWEEERKAAKKAGRKKLAEAGQGEHAE
jgi:hypothetical protein